MRTSPTMTPQGRRLRRMSPGGRRLLTAAVSVAGHLGLLLALLTSHPKLPEPPAPEPMIVELVQPRPPLPKVDPVTPLKPPQPAPAQPPPPRNVFRKTPAPPPEVVVEAAGDGPSAEGSDELSDAQAASAATAGSGAPGGTCDMVRWLQGALRKDSRVQAAVAEVHRGKALVVWNGDWVRHGDQEGAGLAAVREAIMWEVAFAPAACRARPVHGLVLISLADGPGAARVVVGAGDWRWSDLLLSRSGGVEAGASLR
ncbi:hypothetical protein [Phenylobacterium sp.]|jgi:hypothetical protein|uniref:hypothetical protein n=1 Tax=Phenylobacterium sp. TaxID=1871053 RepID=UPI002F4280F9